MTSQERATRGLVGHIIAVGECTRWAQEKTEVSKESGRAGTNLVSIGACPDTVSEQEDRQMDEMYWGLSIEMNHKVRASGRGCRLRVRESCGSSRHPERRQRVPSS